MKIERAVVLAAGRGRRLGELTETMPKPLIVVGGVPAIDRILAAIVATGIDSITVVTGYRAEHLEHHIAAISRVPVSFVRQGDRNGTAGALWLARAAVGDLPFILSWGDVVTDPVHYQAVVAAWEPGLAGAIGVNEVEDVSALSSVVFDEDLRITAMIEKPASPPPSHWNSSGIMVLGSQVWRHIESLEPSARGELELPDAITSMVAAGETLRAVPLSGAWFDIGTPKHLEAARDTYAT